MAQTTVDILSVASWANSDAFSGIDGDRVTQVRHYETNGADTAVMTLVRMISKTFGTIAEQIIVEIFNLGPRTSTQNDGTLNGKKIEIKCARYWAGKDDCKWQHLEPDHDFDYALFVLLDFHGWKVWGIKKSLLMGELRDKKIVVRQGEEGYMTAKSKILPYLTEIKSIADLTAFVQ